MRWFAQAIEQSINIGIALLILFLRLLGFIIHYILRAFQFFISFLYVVWNAILQGIGFVIFTFRFFLFGFIIGFFLILSFLTYQLVLSLPSPKNIGKANYQMTSYIYDRNGVILYEIYHEKNRTPVKLKDIPLHLQQAVIAIEDKDFYYHQGISLSSGIIRAIKDTFVTKELQGGSTITQQLVKTSLLSSERTFIRKFKEMIIAMWAEKMYTKKEILEMYLNQIPFGGESYGVEEAAKTYFQKNVKDLTLSESAVLASLIRAPSYYSPYARPKALFERRNLVLKQMQNNGYITKPEYYRATYEKITTAPLQSRIKAPHFVFFVKGELEQMYGTRIVEEGGLQVHTTLDYPMQKKIEDIIETNKGELTNYGIRNIGVVVMQPSTGNILAMVGSLDYFAENGAYNAATAFRQPGSSIKPFVYALAFEKGYTDSTQISDTQTDFGGYIPRNYDGVYHGLVTVRTALANSYNIPALKTVDYDGVNDFVALMKKTGIIWNDPSKLNITLGLGSGEVRMIDLAQSYTIFPNKGFMAKTNWYSRIYEGYDEKTVSQKPQLTKIISTNTASGISDILADNEARRLAFGSHSVLEIPGHTVSVKTGTTDMIRDNWTIGFTEKYLVAVWVGNNDNTPLSSGLVSGITGAAPIWNKIMTYLLEK